MRAGSPFGSSNHATPRLKYLFGQTDNHPQTTPTTPEPTKTAPVETKPMEQPAKVAPPATPEKK